MMVSTPNLRIDGLVLGVLIMVCGANPALSEQAQQESRSSGTQTAQEFQKDREAAKRYLSEEKAALAIPFLEKARAIDGSDFDNGFDLAQAYTQTGQLESARAEARHLLAIKNTADVHTLIGSIETAAHSPNAAAAEYQIAAQMDPSEGRIFDFGRSLIGFESDADIRIFSYGVEKYPKSSILRIGLGEAFDFHGNYEKAAEVLGQAMDIDPDDPRPMDFLGKLPVVSPETTKRIDQRFSQFLKTHPDNANTNYYLARDLLNPKSGAPSDDDLVRGEQLLKTAIRLDPNMADAYFEMGRLRERKGQQKEAVLAYEHAVRLSPDQEKYRYRLSFSYRAVGKTEKADEELRAFERLQSQHASVAPLKRHETEGSDRR
jgi:tetratricopeptide (TPR) repeat protein